MYSKLNCSGSTIQSFGNCDSTCSNCNQHYSYPLSQCHGGIFNPIDPGEFGFVCIKQLAVLASLDFCQHVSNLTCGCLSLAVLRGYMSGGSTFTLSCVASLPASLPAGQTKSLVYQDQACDGK